MKFGNVLVIWFLLIVSGFGVMFAGWGLAFAFATNVFVPWLGFVTPEYHNLASFLGACLFVGTGTALVLVALVTLGFGATALYRRIKGR
ncbi:MAG: hypothetical protein IT343_06300 [Candidatus Melainabacteria bacterium]|jgi:hypothetical protein|nr:hypothetical protein [Candidatus Melainabacteria bacterium]